MVANSRPFPLYSIDSAQGTYLKSLPKMTSCLLMTSFSCLLQNEESTTRLQDSASNSWASLLRSLHREESTTSKVILEKKSQKWSNMSNANRPFYKSPYLRIHHTNKRAMNIETIKPKYCCNIETSENQTGKTVQINTALIKAKKYQTLIQ